MNFCELSEGFMQLKVERDGVFEITGKINSFEYAGRYHYEDRKVLSFIEHPKYADKIDKSVTCVITNGECSDYIPKELGVAVCDDPKNVFYMVHNYLTRRYPPPDGYRNSNRAQLPDC